MGGFFFFTSRRLRAENRYLLQVNTRLFEEMGAKQRRAKQLIMETEAERKDVEELLGIVDVREKRITMAEETLHKRLLKPEKERKKRDEVLQRLSKCRSDLQEEEAVLQAGRAALAEAIKACKASEKKRQEARKEVTELQESLTELLGLYDCWKEVGDYCSTRHLMEHVRLGFCSWMRRYYSYLPEWRNKVDCKWGEWERLTGDPAYSSVFKAAFLPSRAQAMMIKARDHCDPLLHAQARGAPRNPGEKMQLVEAACWVFERCETLHKDHPVYYRDPVKWDGVLALINKYLGTSWSLTDLEALRTRVATRKSFPKGGASSSS